MLSERGSQSFREVWEAERCVIAFNCVRISCILCPLSYVQVNENWRADVLHLQIGISSN